MITVASPADQEGADARAVELAREVLGVLALRSHAAEIAAGRWGEVPVVLASSEGAPGIGEVLGAIERHEPDAAESAMRHHLRMVLREIPRLRDQHPEYFDE